MTEFYLKGIYPVEVLSGAQDGLVEVRAKTFFCIPAHIQVEKVKLEWA
ncbi:MAG: hypothetical protein NWE93_01380 [Candidatus Bathyarchaeota archaeon]|nr:hypothetical protein [Candidatus Bathyarchaeota archaeon]